MYESRIPAGLWNRLLFALAFAFALFWWVASPAEAEEFNPTNTEELIVAMNDANANGEADTINLVPGATYTLTEAFETDPNDIENLAGPTGLPPILARQGLTNNEIEINGNGAMIERSSAEGTPEFRIFAVTRRSGDFPTPTLTLTDLTIRGGSSVEGQPNLDGGGAILSFGGYLNITNTTITENTSAQYGGGVLSDAGNASSPESGTTKIINSTIAGNSAELGGGGIQSAGGTTEISYSTIANNSVIGDDSGLRGGGVGTRSSFSGNVITRLTANIVAGNTSVGGAEGEQPDDIASITENFGFQSDGYNVMGEANRAENFGQPGDVTDVEIVDAFGTSFPRLQDNGGPTQTIALRSGSEAINRVEADDAPPTDQRGFLRPVGRILPDTGAYEFRAVLPAPEASLSPESLDFGLRRLGESSNPRTVTLTNTGNGSSEVEGSFLRVDSTSISGEDADQFRIESNTCDEANLAPGEECEIAVVFSPDSRDGKSASLEVQTNAQDDPPVVSLTGTGPKSPQSPASACTIKGTPGNDNLRGTNGRDVICGLSGNDTIYGLGGADVIRGGAGINVIYGGEGKDRIIGGLDTDRIHGQNGNDTILGLGGKDILRGDAGDDRLFGGADNDALIGGPGKDTLNGGPGSNFLKQ